MCSVNLREHITGINKEDFILFGGVCLCLVKEPQGSRERNRGEHIGGQCHHLADDAFLNHLLADIVFAVSGIGGGVCHNESSLAIVLQCRCKIGNPQIVGIGYSFFFVTCLFRCFGFVLRNAVGVETGIVLHTLIHHLIYIEGWICHDIVESANGIIGVGIEGVRLGDFTTHIVQQ